MKKSVFLLLPIIFLVACGIYKPITVDRLQLGMTKADVENIFGRPEKILLVSLTEHGQQEILAYKIGYNDLYTLEFMNDQLLRYEFLREYMAYEPRPLPPPVVVIPDNHYPVPPKPVEHPPVTKPSPQPLPPAQPVRQERRPNRENTREEARPGRRPGGSENTDQVQQNERTRPETSETNRRERGNTGSGQSNGNSRSSEDSSSLRYQ